MQDSPGNRSRRAIVHRRNLLAGAAVTGTASLLGHHSATSAQALEKPAVSEFETALKKIMGWVKLHPYNIAQKVEIVVEHYRSYVAQLLNGQAKALVVVSSRLEAVRWQRALNTGSAPA